MYLIEVGCGEFPINFAEDFTSTWLSMSVLGALACSCGDTYASELGSVIGSSEPRLITSLSTKVPRGNYTKLEFKKALYCIESIQMKY